MYLVKNLVSAYLSSIRSGHLCKSGCNTKNEFQKIINIHI